MVRVDEIKVVKTIDFEYKMVLGEKKKWGMGKYNTRPS